MELNCLIFPAKTRVNIDHIKDSVLLIPKNPNSKHIYYSNYLKNKTSNPYEQVTSNIVIYQVDTNQYPQKKNQIKNPLTKEQIKLNQMYAAKELGDVKTLPLQNKGERQKVSQIQKAESIKVKDHIPCLFLEGNSKIILYFHGNAQDLGSTYQFLNFIHQSTSYTILAMEYEGYSIYQGEPTAEKIENDSVYLISYLLGIGFDSKNMIILGRSIGSGPAIHVASKFIFAGLVLVSPFLSICELIKDKYGLLASMLVQQRFINYEKIQNSYSPCLILHGLNDSIIPAEHAIKLQKKYKGFCKLKLIERMTHMSFDFREDFLYPMTDFFKSIKF